MLAHASSAITNVCISCVPSGGSELLQTLPITQIYNSTHREGSTRGSLSPILEPEWDHHDPATGATLPSLQG